MSMLYLKIFFLSSASKYSSIAPIICTNTPKILRFTCATFWSLFIKKEATVDSTLDLSNCDSFAVSKFLWLYILLIVIATKPESYG